VTDQIGGCYITRCSRKRGTKFTLLLRIVFFLVRDDNLMNRKIHDYKISNFLTQTINVAF
jgi:hypothetical protein